MLKGFLVGAVIGTVISVAGLLGTSYFLGQDTGGVVEQAQEAARPDPVAVPSPDPSPAAAPEPEPRLPRNLGGAFVLGGRAGGGERKLCGRARLSDLATDPRALGVLV
jgi:hypothetical protein